MNNCCCIPDQTKLNEGCPQEAAYRIISGPTSDDYTESCATHLEQMLDDSRRFEIVRLA